MDTLKFVLLYCIFVLSRAEYLKCPTHQQHFEKIVGYRPSAHYDMNMNFNIMKNSDVIPEFKQLNIDCWSQCYKDPNCFGYIYFLTNNTCFGYSIRGISDDPYYTKYHKLSLSPDANAVFFQKMCLKVPEYCLPKMWPIIRYPRALVMPQEYERSQKLMSRRECVESCIHEKKFTCYSVIFIPSSRNNFIRSRDPSLTYMNRDIGQCVLNTMRSPLLNGTSAGNYSSAFFRMEYIENQCIEDVPSDDVEPSDCSFEKYYNRTFIYAESSIEGSLEDCQKMCFDEDSFYCRGISYITKTKMCFLHSDDIASFSNLSLVHSYGAVYMRRVECLNVTVACMDDEMVLKFRPKGFFAGHLYLNSRYRNCSVQKNLNSYIDLKIPFGDEIQENLCGIVRAYERRDDVNRTLISTLIVIQNNPLMRTYDDRLIKIGCVVNNNEEFERISRENKEKINNPVHAVQETHAQERIFNNDMFKFVKIELFDFESGIKVSELTLGQKVQIKIQSESLSEKFSFRVLNLTAISESGEEMLLLDEKGCPEDPLLISIFNSEKIGKQLILSSHFRAFKFFDSPRVIFRFFLQFCTQNCQQMNCRKMKEKEIGGMYSMGNDTEVFRNLQSSPTHMDMLFPEIFHQYGDNSVNNTIVTLNDDNVDSSEVQYQRVLASLGSEEEDDDVKNASQVFQKYNNFISLAMYDFLVYSEDARSESLVYGNDPPKKNVTDPTVNTFKFDDLLCVDTTLLKILFSLFIVLLLLVIIISYCCIRRYRRLAEYDSNSFGSSSLNERRRHYLPKFLQGHRHVKWADENYGFVY